MTTKTLVNYEDVEKYITNVIEEADNDKKALGFFVPEMYHQLAQKGGLWVLVENDNYIGHILFSVSLRKYKITINQTHIISEKRNMGFAKSLIDYLKKYGEQNNIIDITAKVASDLKEANRFYEKMGFHLVAQEKGGISTKRELNVRKYNLPNLLTYTNSKIVPKLPESTLASNAYVLDTNLILDFLENRSWKDSVSRLFTKALGGILSLYISNETKNELFKKTKDENDFRVELLKTLPVLKKVPKSFTITQEDILELIFGTINPSSNSAKNKLADAKHIQETLFNRCGCFLTRDAHLLKKSTEVFKKYGIEIISINEFIDADVVDCNEFSKIYYHIQDKTSKLCLNNEYIIHQLPNEILPFHEFLKNKFKNSKIHQLTIYSETKLTAFALWDTALRKKGQFDVFLFLNFEGMNTLFEQVMTCIKRFASNYQSKILCLHFLQDDITKFQPELNKNSFYEMNENGQKVFKKVLFEAVINENNWTDFVKIFNNLYKTSLPEKLISYSLFKTNGVQINEKQRYDFTEFESIVSPSIIIPKGRPIAIIPIKEDFASDFFNFNTTPQLSLGLYPKRETFLCDQKAYFRTPKYIQNLEDDAIALFYVSKPCSSVVGLAKIKRILTVSLQDILEEQKNYGVIEENDLSKISKNGLIQCIIFENFISFTKYIPLKKLKEIGIGKANFITPEAISVENFNKIYKLTY